MSFYRQRSHDIPALNTASLPDLIFTILFFFMLVTQMRKITVKVKYRVPQGTELTRLTKKTTTSYIYVGKQMNNLGEVESDSTSIQLNDKIVQIAEIKNYLLKERQDMDAIDKKQMMVSIRGDKDTRMGIMIDIKQTLRESNVLNVNYIGTLKDKEGIKL
ncbi:biopolymer transporter ExbD [Prevotella brunnea]|uniref:Biopolymer transporter ExbD n=1 Tax=Prevotella brunnea TaxID=2508867 RepID=A0A5C8GK21_9BACT|nr:biopolymer transporter ExbD [Prevotella brunnea]MDR0186599.1 biopolymer transporter ExbD [Prevotella brunnea]TXJ62342.1 biopolymer transporter ExbD [Prevotella brunnea]